jgi:DNA-directed RNA polymerase subunit RPC12/RpoP
MDADEREVSRAAAKLRGTHGAIVLTSHRVLFQHISGLMTKRTFTVLDVPLPAVREVKRERGFPKAKLVLIAQGEGYSGLPRIEIEVDSAERWVSMISSQISSRRLEIEEEKRKSRIQYVVDFSFLKAQMERGGIALTSLKCPSCGASVQMPAEGSQFKCVYCGSMVQSQDVYERMKGLLQTI